MITQIRKWLPQAAGILLRHRAARHVNHNWTCGHWHHYQVHSAGAWPVSHHLEWPWTRHRPPTSTTFALASYLLVLPLWWCMQFWSQYPTTCGWSTMEATLTSLSKHHAWRDPKMTRPGSTIWRTWSLFKRWRSPLPHTTTIQCTTSTFQNWQSNLFGLWWVLVLGLGFSWVNSAPDSCVLRTWIQLSLTPDLLMNTCMVQVRDT